MDSNSGSIDPVLKRAQARVGRVLCRKWRLDALLGIGGMAAVYSATHRNGRRIAVKMLHSELSVDHDVRTRFLREAYIANKIDHPGAVIVLDDDVADEGAAFLVMELLEGEPLDARAQRKGGRLDADEVLSLADQVLDVLAAAHERGVVHRDLKPENLFLCRDGVVKVLDFGIARLREATSASTATRSGATMGTPSYMAPEHARALWNEVDARTDIWAVGATMFVLLTGRLVHEGRTGNEALLSAMTTAAPPIASLVPGISPSVAAVVDRALAFEKRDRWPDARSMQTALREAYYSTNGSPISTAPKLIVPILPVEKTRLSAGGEGRAWHGNQATVTTAGAVSAGRTGVGLSLAERTRRPTALVATGGLTLILVLATVVALDVLARRQPAADGVVSASNTASAPPSDLGSSPAVAPIPAASILIVSVSDLPVVSPGDSKDKKTQKPSPEAKRKSPPPSAPTSPPTPASTADPRERRR